MEVTEWPVMLTVLPMAGATVSRTQVPFKVADVSTIKYSMPLDTPSLCRERDI
ncbi:MAG: hypothetical protein ABIT37_22960 [Luteolibacter sp.]